MNNEPPGVGSPNQHNAWICERLAVQNRLGAIVARLKFEPACMDREDLVQEGLLQIWRMEHERPGQTLSWYLKNAEFHIRNLLGGGRSLDASKRGTRRVELVSESSAGEKPVDATADLALVPDPMFQISADEMVELLHRSLKGPDRLVLDVPLEGRGTCEIGGRCHLDHGGVVKRLKRIAAMARKMGGVSRLGE
jgi:DNA-directed RNA polymerase specialized sigma24 family protein